MTQAPAVLSGPLHPHGHQSRLARAVLRLFGWRVESPGLPAEQGVILVYPHTSNWDFVVGVLAKWALGLQLRFWGKDSLFKVPLLGSWVRYLGGVAVDRSSHHGIVGDTVRQMREAAVRGERFWLAVAPEGTRSQDGQVGKFKKGGFLLAQAAGTQIIPLTIDGSRDILPKHSRSMKKGVHVTLTYGPPIEPTGRPLDELIAEVRGAIVGQLR